LLLLCAVAGASTAVGPRSASPALVILCCTTHMPAQLQVQAVKPCAPLSLALEMLLTRCRHLVPQALSHPLQVVRAASVGLVPPYLAVLRSKIPLLLSSESTPASENTAAAMLDLVQAAYAAAGEAVTAANAAGVALDSSEGLAGQPPAVVAWEAAISSAAALTEALHASGTSQPMLQDVLLPAMQWAIEAQGLQHPQLKSTVHLLRHLIAGLMALVLDEEHVSRVVNNTVQCLAGPMWQSRGTAVAVLQCSWFRCAPDCACASPTSPLLRVGDTSCDKTQPDAAVFLSCSRSTSVMLSPRLCARGFRRVCLGFIFR
jgi:hypothetical protein